MVRWVVGSILHGVDTLSYFSFQPVLHDWCNKGRGMCYSVCGMVHIKEPLLLIGKSSPWGEAGFISCYLSGPLPYALYGLIASDLGHHIYKMTVIYRITSRFLNLLKNQPVEKQI